MASTITTDALATRLDAQFAKVARRRARAGLPAPQALVRAPGFEYVSGDTELPFHAASVGKLATAALVMQEVEGGRLVLDAPVTSLLPDAETTGLFAAPGATVEHLLGHTSGLADYFEDPVRHGAPMRELLAAEPDRAWTPQALLDFSREHQRPLAAPGRRFRYSDTGFVLLGRIVEEATGTDLTTLLRSRVLDRAGMGSTVHWQREPGPERIAPLWLGEHELSRARSVSCDWAAGGLVSTLEDLARLSDAMRDGTLVRPETWALMTRPRRRFHHGIHYGLGAMQVFLGRMALMPGLPRPTGHLGVLGVHCFSDAHSTVILNFHSTEEMRASFQTHIRIAAALVRARR